MLAYSTIGPANRIGPQGRRLGLAELPPGVGLPRTFTLMEQSGGDLSVESTWQEEFATVIRVYGWNPPPFHDPLSAGGSQTITANTNFTTLFSKAIPSGYLGCLAYWGQSLAAPDVPNVTWTLRISGRAIRDFESVIGLYSSLTNLEWIMQPIPPGGNLAVFASNTSAADIANVGARVRGWIWPIGTYRTRA